MMNVTEAPVMYYTVYKLTMIVGAPVIVLLGLLGNIFSLVVLRSQFFRAVPSSVGFTLLAITDILILLTLLLPWTEAITDGARSLSRLSDASCKLSNFLTHFLAFLGPWTLGLVTVERLVSVVRPAAHGRLCTGGRVLAVWGVTAGILAALNLHFFWTSRLVIGGYTGEGEGGFAGEAGYGGEGDCTSHGQHIFVWDVWPWVDFVFSFAAPFLIIACCNGGIILYMCKNYHRYRNTAGIETSRLDRVTSTTLMLVSVSLVHLVTTSPLVITGLCFNLGIADLPSHLNQDGRLSSLIIDVVTLLFHLNSAVNFLLYYLTNSVFRRGVRYFFCCSSPQTDGNVTHNSWNQEVRTEISLEQMPEERRYTY